MKITEGAAMAQPVPVAGYRYVPMTNFGGNDLTSHPNDDYGTFHYIETPRLCKKFCDATPQCAGFQVNLGLNKCLYKTAFPEGGGKEDTKQWAYVKTTVPQVVYYGHCWDVVSGGALEQRPASAASFANLSGIGFSGPEISAVQMPAGYTATCYENDNYTGASIIIDASTLNEVCLTQANWNDRIRSCKITSGQPTASGQPIKRPPSPPPPLDWR